MLGKSFSRRQNLTGSRQGSGRSSVKGSRLQKFVTAKRAASPFERTGKKSQKNGPAPNQGAGNEAVSLRDSFVSCCVDVLFVIGKLNMHMN